MPELDLLKVLALAGVIVIHAAAWVVPAETPPLAGPWALVIALARFCVPAFVFASGLAVQRSRAARPEAAGAFLRRRWSRTLLPWLIWTPLYLLLDLSQGLLAPAQAPGWLLYGAGHLYFLLLVAQLYPLALVAPSGNRRLIPFALGLLALQAVLGAAHAHGPLEADRWAAAQAPFWAGYFACGMLAGAYYERLLELRRLWPLALAAVAATTWVVLAEAQSIGGDYWRQGEYSFLWPSRIANTAAICLAAIWGGDSLQERPAWLFAAAREISRRSLGIYILQSAVLVFLGPRTSALPGPVRVAVLVAIAFAGAHILTVLLSQTAAGRVALGEAASTLPGRARRRLGTA